MAFHGRADGGTLLDAYSYQIYISVYKNYLLKPTITRTNDINSHDAEGELQGIMA